MRILVKCGVLLLALLVCSCDGAVTRAPVAKAIPHQLQEHGNRRVDDYFWLKERGNPEVIAYLQAENEYTAAVMADTEELQAKLFEEIKGRIKQTDASVPYFLDGYYYYERYEDGKEYPIYCRKKSLEGNEEIMLDVNREAEGHNFCSVRNLAVSSGNDILAYAIDTVGRRKYTIRFKNLESGEMLADTIPEVTGNSAWANDNRTIFYSKQHPETLRSYRVYRHVLGTDAARDELVFEETDETFGTFVTKTKSKRFILIGCEQTLSSEYRFLDADDPTGEFTVIQPRERDLEYHVAHRGDMFYIRTNYRAPNFRLMAAPVSSPGKESWQEVIPHREDAFLKDYELFDRFLVVSERRGGLPRFRIIPWDGSDEHELDFGEPTYEADFDENPQFATEKLRYTYSSLATPESIYDYDMAGRKKILMKQKEILGGFDPADYVTERINAPARDGVRVPISVLYRKGIEKDGGNPLLLYGYGSYGSNVEPYFRPEILSLVDRGFVFAIAHIRGGQEMGRHWYENGKLLKKKNSFYDFIDCAKHLIKEGYTSPDRLFARGGSAGGLLVGAVANMAPELFTGIIAHVPWVDVITTMFDASIPLTTSEYDEWGDPADRKYYEYMLSYSPYDNVTAKDYPNMLVTTSLHDSQVQYWEPAKWVAKLRALKTDDNLLLLKTDMEAGHGGASGRFKQYREYAFEYAFILKVLGRMQ